jgi:hypothetical protein
MTGTEIYRRTETYEKQARAIRIHAPHWRLLLAFDGQRTLAEVALSAETSFADAVPLTQKFLENDWIAEEPITLDQYLKRTGAKDLATLSSAVPPAVVLHEPSAEKAAPAPLVAPPSPIAVVATPPAPVPIPAAPYASAPAAPVAPALVPPPSAPPPLPKATAPVVVSPPVAEIRPGLARSPRGAMKLSAVVDAITQFVGNISLGQLLVYRVFLRVPPDLLLAEDIASVHLANDTSLIQGEKLQNAIAAAVAAVAKKSLPDSVYVTA